MPSKLSLTFAEAFDVSSSIMGRLFSISAFASKATSVVLKSPMYCDSAGFAQTLQASIKLTDLPPSVSPQRSTKNGSIPRGFIKALANDAANINFISGLPVARKPLT